MKIFNAMKLLIVVIFFSSLLIFFLKINLWDYDFWWHIATGKYIVTEKHLPDKDPFSFTSGMEENKNAFPEWERFILKQYWLAQSFFYLVFMLAGAKGIIFLRSLMLVLTLFTVFWQLNKARVSLYISFLFLFLLFTVSTIAIGERPVLFSFLFVAILFSILEDFRIQKSKKIYLLPPLMLLWANLHGGFIIGDTIIAAFLVGESMKIILKKSSFTKQEKILFYSASLLAVACSFINPSGWNAFIMVSSRKYSIFTANIQEWKSPFYLYINKIHPIELKYVLLGLMTPLILLVRNRKLDYDHILLLVGFYFMAATASRLIFFYAIIATMIVAKETDLIVTGFFRKKLSVPSYRKVEYLLTIAALFSIMLFLVGHFKYREFEFAISSKTSVPEAAVDFIEKSKLPGNMFNDFGYGGYITWRLYPWKKNFIDTRSLNITTIAEYDWIMRATHSAENVNPSASNTPLWERLLTHYKINFMLLSLFDIFGEAMPLVFEIVEQDTWVPLYCDPISLVLIKNSPENKPFIEKYRLPKEAVYNAMMVRASTGALADKYNPRHLVALGDTFHRAGRLDDAIQAYEYALKRMPESADIRERLNMLKSEKDDKKGVQKSDANPKL